MKLYALGIPLAVLSAVLVIATIVPYRATQSRMTEAREDIAVVIASREVEQNTVETMWHTLRLVLTGDADAARSIERSQRASSEALSAWLASEKMPGTKRNLAEMARQKRIMDGLVDHVIATVADGDLQTARNEFYEDVYPSFDQGFDEDVDELLRRQDVQLRDGFNGLAGATGPAGSLFGRNLTAQIAAASGYVARTEIAADFIAELTDASVEMVELALDDEPDLDEAEELRAEVFRVLASWERSLSTEGSEGADAAIVHRMLQRFDALGATEDAVLAHATEGDIVGAVELLAGPYTDRLQRMVSDAEQFIDAKEAWIITTIDAITADARRLNATVSLGAIMVFLIGGAFVVVLARKLSRRLHALTAAADRMRAGDLSVRVGVETPDELGELGRTFNLMGEALLDAHDRLASLFGRSVETGERERTQLAADLHDGPVQRLTTVGYIVERISQLLARDAADQAEPLVEGLKKSLGTEVRDLRRMMSELRPPALDTRGLRAAVDDYATDFGVRHEMDVTIDVCEDRLAPALETTVYRVMQEALTNIAKHAQASRVDLSITSRADAVVLSVRDDGVGFDPSQKLDSIDHFGLAGMEQRVRIAGGAWTVDSIVGEGTTLSARFPVADRTLDREPSRPSQRSDSAPAR